MDDAFSPADRDEAEVQTPTTGLMGDWYIINVPQTTTFSGAATAIRATGATNARGNFVHFPQLSTAAVTVTADANNLTADPLFRTTQVLTNANATPATVPALSLLNYDLPDAVHALLRCCYCCGSASGSKRKLWPMLCA